VDVSIIVVNWNGRGLLARCLQCVESTVKQVRYEVIVVDNASTDGSQEMVKCDFPNTRLIENTQNVGFAAANNQGMEIAQGRFVLLLNSDAFVKDGTVDTMVAFMDAHPEAGMAGCKLLYDDGRLQRSCTSFPSLATELYSAIKLDKLLPKSPIFGKYRLSYWNFDDIREVDVIMGAFMMVRREAIDQVGAMDASYFMYSEEVDWCYRFKNQGWKILYYPEVEAIHLWGGTSKQVQLEMFVQMYQSRIHFFRKNYGRFSVFLLKILLYLNCVLRVGLGRIYYLRETSPQLRQKQDAFWRLLRVLPSL